MSVGVIAALPAEAAAFCGRHVARRRSRIIELEGALLSCCGIGDARAQHAAEELVERGATGLVSWGLAGGLRDGVRAGDLLVSEVVLDRTGRRWICDPAWRRDLEDVLRHAGLPVRAGEQLTAGEVAATAADKRQLAATGALGIDMESAAVARVASSAGVAFVVLRAVCDETDDEVPRAALEGVDADGHRRPGRILWSLVRRPGDMRALLKLRRGCHAALQSLRRAASEAGPQLARPSR